MMGFESLAIVAVAVLLVLAAKLLLRGAMASAVLICAVIGLGGTIWALCAIAAAIFGLPGGH